jgi:crotonobetainyl-CoA:carnitine CoA-transferase CaiB-like acyl-CoA transferase
MPMTNAVMETEEKQSSGPLKGVRVLEMGTLIAGPFCGQLLGDMGADVIKIEPPGEGDPMRSWGRGDPKVWWSVIARNKKSVTVDLRKDAGQELIRKLALHTDILIENFRPGTMEKWGLGYDVLKKINPGIIMVRVSGYGQTGPYSSRAGFGGIAEAMGGLRYLSGYPETPPSRIGISIGDSLAASFGCMGALAALNHRHVSGEGQVVDVAIYEAVLAMMESTVPEYTVANFIRERTGSTLPKIAPSNVYRCKDGEFLIGANQDTVFKRLCQAMGQEQLATDARYATHVARGDHMEELDARIADWTATLTMDELEALMEQYGVPAGKMYRAPEMLNDPQFIARDAIVDVDHPQFENLKMHFPACR